MTEEIKKETQKAEAPKAEAKPVEKKEHKFFHHDHKDNK